MRRSRFPFSTLSLLGLPLAVPAAAALFATARVHAAPSLTASDAGAVVDGGDASVPSIEAKNVVLPNEFSVAGGGDDGSRYLGKLSLSRVAWDSYAATWNFGAHGFSGVVIRDGEVLSAGWAKNASDINVLSYAVQADGLVGRVVKADSKKVGGELLKPATGVMTDDLVGKYLQNGKGPDGKKYAGSVVISKVGEGTFTLKWVVGGSIIHGLGIRSKRENGDVLTVAFPSAASDYGARQYVIGADRKLRGTWIQSVSGILSSGTEQSTQ